MQERINALLILELYVREKYVHMRKRKRYFRVAIAVPDHINYYST